MSACGYDFICLNWIISWKVQKMSWTLDGKIRNNARLSNTSFMRAYSWTSVSLRRLYIGQFPPLHFKDRDEGFVSKGSKDILHENKMFSCTMELPNESAVSLWFLFCLFCFHFGRICDLYFRQKYWKSFYSWDTVFNKLQAFLFFLLWGIKVGIKTKHILHSWVADQSTGLLLARGSYLNIK